MTNLPEIFGFNRNIPSIFDYGNSLLGEMFKDFDSLFSSGWTTNDRRFVDSDGNVVYEIEVPGFNKDNLKVEVSDGILTVKGEIKTDNFKRKVFKRMTVSDSENVDAEIKDGILTLRLIRPPSQNVKKIDIK